MWGVSCVCNLITHHSHKDSGQTVGYVIVSIRKKSNISNQVYWWFLDVRPAPQLALHSVCQTPCSSTNKLNSAFSCIFKLQVYIVCMHAFSMTSFYCAVLLYFSSVPQHPHPPSLPHPPFVFILFKCEMRLGKWKIWTAFLSTKSDVGWLWG